MMEVDEQVGSHGDVEALKKREAAANHRGEKEETADDDDADEPPLRKKGATPNGDLKKGGSGKVTTTAEGNGTSRTGDDEEEEEDDEAMSVDGDDDKAEAEQVNSEAEVESVVGENGEVDDDDHPKKEEVAVTVTKDGVGDGKSESEESKSEVCDDDKDDTDAEAEEDQKRGGAAAEDNQSDISDDAEEQVDVGAKEVKKGVAESDGEESKTAVIREDGEVKLKLKDMKPDSIEKKPESSDKPVIEKMAMDGGDVATVLSGDESDEDKSKMEVDEDGETMAAEKDGKEDANKSNKKAVEKVKKKVTTTKVDESDADDDDQSDTTPTKTDKKQTVIITETKSLAQAINNAAREPDDGSPTLVIIESKSGKDTNTTSSKSSTSTSTPKSLVTGSPRNMTTRSATQSLPAGHNSLRSALLQGSSLARAARPLLQVAKTSKPDPSQGVALQDDAEVSVYTPSLVVPYLFECPAKESLSEFVAKIAPADFLLAKAERERLEKEERDNAEPPLPAARSAAGKSKSFFDSALGNFFMDIGLSQVQQWVQTEIFKAQKRKLDRGWKTKEREGIVSSLQKTLSAIQTQNKPYQFKSRKCGRCNFVTESKTVLDRHLETIHVSGHRMQCSFCSYDTIDPSQIFHHLYTVHKAFGRLERPPTCHMCPLCPFEDSGKARVTRHTWKCVKTFAADKNLSPTADWEPPAKRTRHLASVATLKALRGGNQQGGLAGAVGGGVAVQGSRVPNQLQQMARVRPNIVPKPADLRLTPAYVQSVLRGQYMQQSRANAPITIRGGVTYARPPLPSQQQTRAYILPRQQQQVSGATTLTPVTSGGGGAATAYLQGNQLYQVVRTNVGPVLRNTAPPTLAQPRYTILPTAVNTGNRGGPTPVALIPNLATTGGTQAGKPQAYPVSRHNAVNSPMVGNRLQPQLSSTKPNISITPVANKARPAQLVASSSGGARPSPGQVQQQRSGATTLVRPSPPSGSRSGQAQQVSAGGSGANNPSYVVCEICDGYIKDLDQLRNHMQWIHKVKIHPKMIHNRPPLNCQKCHYRFFTDQGLERHLLGSHGLVTSSMQENANKGKDGGRCTICGKVFLWKLVVHMAKDHRMTLKPAHLSYKCTVCSATFNMYRLFETHVYEEHSTVAKRVLDGPSKPLPAGFGSKSGSGTSKPSATAAASLVRKEAAASSSSGTVESRLRSCVECGVEFRCTENCISHFEKNHLKPCQVKLCRVDKCQACTNKVRDAQAAEKQQAAEDEAATISDDDDDVMVVTPEKKVPPVETLDDDSDDDVPVKPAASRNGKAATTPAAAEQDEMEDDDDVASVASSKKSVAATSEKSAAVVTDSSDGESPDPPAKRARLDTPTSDKHDDDDEEQEEEVRANVETVAPVKKAAEKKVEVELATKKRKVAAAAEKKTTEAKKAASNSDIDDDDGMFDTVVEEADEEERNSDVESD